MNGLRSWKSIENSHGENWMCCRNCKSRMARKMVYFLQSLASICFQSPQLIGMAIDNVTDCLYPSVFVLLILSYDVQHKRKIQYDICISTAWQIMIVRMCQNHDYHIYKLLRNVVLSRRNSVRLISVAQAHSVPNWQANALYWSDKICENNQLNIIKLLVLILWLLHECVSVCRCAPVCAWIVSVCVWPWLPNAHSLNDRWLLLLGIVQMLLLLLIIVPIHYSIMHFVLEPTALISWMNSCQKCLPRVKISAFNSWIRISNTPFNVWMECRPHRMRDIPAGIRSRTNCWKWYIYKCSRWAKNVAYQKPSAKY